MLRNEEADTISDFGFRILCSASAAFRLTALMPSRGCHVRKALPIADCRLPIRPTLMSHWFLFFRVIRPKKVSLFFNRQSAIGNRQ